ncbi:MAG: hypothetical protein AAF565_14395 [Pseudomonadota bacterium]
MATETLAERIADRFVALVVERAIPAVRAGRLFDGWALDPADPEDEADFLEGSEGLVRTASDEALIIYQREGAAAVHVRAVPVDTLIVEEAFAQWARATLPPCRVVPRPIEDVAMFVEGPHPEGGAVRVRLGFSEDPDERGTWQAHAAVSWLRPRS